MNPEKWFYEDKNYTGIEILDYSIYIFYIYIYTVS